MKIFIKILLILVIANTCFANSFPEKIGLESEKIISSKNYNNNYPNIDNDENNIVIVWQGTKEDHTHVFISVSSNGGISFDNAITVAAVSNKEFMVPDVCIFGDNIIVVFTDINGDLKIYLSNDMGNTWELKSILSDTRILNPSIEKWYRSDSGWMLGLYYISKNGKYSINAIYSPDAGNTWSVPATITELNIDSSSGLFFPSFAYTTNSIHMAYEDRVSIGNYRIDRIYMIRSDDNAGSWTEPQQITKISNTNEAGKRVYESCFTPSLSIISNRIGMLYLCKSGKSAYRLQYRTLDFSGKINNAVNVISNQSISSFRPMLINDIAFWYDNSSGTTEVYYSKYPFNEKQKIRKTGNGSSFHSVANSRSDAFITFRNKGYVYFTKLDKSVKKPVVRSKTHKSGVWSFNTKISVSWNLVRDPAGLKGYAYLFDQDPGTVPDIINLNENVTSMTLSAAEKGEWYFHLIAIDKLDNASEVTHYEILIDNEPLQKPEIYSLTHREYIPSETNNVEFSYICKSKREIAGYSYIFTKDSRNFPDKKIMTQNTNVRFPNTGSGIWYFIISACDRFGNWSESAQYTINIQKDLVVTKKIKEVEFDQKIPEELESRITYTVKSGDVFSRVIKRILNLNNNMAYKSYIKEIGEFNYIYNLDFLMPGDKIMFPCIIARPNDTLDTLANTIFGDSSFRNKLVVYNKITNELRPGDKIIIKNKGFLRTGNVKSVINLK